jgi:hypothetical protein
MATLYAANETLRQAEPQSALDVTLNYGIMYYVSDSYVIPTASELAISDTIDFFDIPKGARVLEMMLTAPIDGGSPATGKMKIGWLASEETDENGTTLEAADDDGFYNDTVGDFGAGALARLQVAATASGYRKKFSGPVKVQATVTEATTDSGDATILLEAYLVKA